MAIGRPKWKPSAQDLLDIEKYASTGVPGHIIAKILGTTEKTLIKHCKDILEQHRSKVKAEFMGALYELGVKERIPSAIFFYLKTQCGYRENSPPAEDTAKKPKQIILSRGPDRHSQIQALEQEATKEAS